MWYLYLDESGDLGFDFVNKKPSKYFTVGILALRGVNNNRKISKAVKMVIRRKLNPKNKRKRMVEELKGEGTTIEIKKYFFDKVKDTKFALYFITLNKLRVYEQLTKNKVHIYNFIARQVLEHIPFEKSDGDRINFILDKCKGKKEIKNFNEYIIRQLEGRIKPNTPFDIYHEDSKKIGGLQAIDMFVWGAHRKYEHEDIEWINIFKKKIQYDDIYLKEK
jgi:hypothetical protein